MYIDFNHVLAEIKPRHLEKEKVYSLSEDLISIINQIANEHNIEAEAVIVGSVAKDTWLGGNADIDIFIKFPVHVDESYLKEKGLFLGNKCIEIMNGTKELRYASHPYVTGFINGFNVDIVPCYNIKSARELKSAVDRTILHTEYIKKRLKEEQKDEVILLKRFMESIDTYGAEFKVGGFSGYLCELLIINYGTFIGVLEAAARKWEPKIVIDIENFNTANQFLDHMIVIDPTDENRNVSAALTIQKISEFIIASRNFLQDPKEDYFFEREFNVDVGKIKNEFKKRDTKTLLIRFKPPKIPADALYPQIKKTENSLKNVLQRRDFKVFNTDSWTDEVKNVVILLELETWILPSIKKHYGPPIWSEDHQKRFLDKYDKNAYIMEDRWIAEIPREYIEVETLIKDILDENKIGILRFGKHIKDEILKEYEIMDISQFLEHLDDENILKFLFLYLNKDYNLYR